MRITIDIADNEFDFIKTAIESKTLALTNYMEHCKDIAKLEQMQTEFKGNAFTVNKRAAARKQVRRTRK